MKRVLPLLLALLVAALAAGGYYVVKNRQSTDSASVVRDESETTEASGSTTTPAVGKKTKTAKPLSLTVTSPANGAVVTGASLTVKGQTAAYAEVFINDLETKADASGIFSGVLVLEEGENYILVMVNDTDGNYKEQELSVTYNSGD